MRIPDANQQQLVTRHARPAPRRWTGRPAQAEVDQLPAGRIPPDVEPIMLFHQANGKSSPTVAAAYTNGAGGDHDDLHSQLRLWRVS